MDKIYVLFVHPEWVSLNNYTKIINEFPPFNFLTVKMGLGFSLIIATRLEVSKPYPGVVGSSCKMCDILPLLSPSIL